MLPDFAWLPIDPNARSRISTLPHESSAAWEEAKRIASLRLDIMAIGALDRAIAKRFPNPPEGAPSLRLALLGSATMKHLHAGLRVAALRRGIWLEIHENAFGQYQQELENRASDLYRFRPDAIILSLDARHITAGLSPSDDAAAVQAHDTSQLARLKHCWALAQQAFRCAIVQQAMLPIFPLLLGQNEHRLPGSPTADVIGFNHRLREHAAAAGVAILSADLSAARDGLARWYDPTLWHHAKQEISPVVAGVWGEEAMQLLTAIRGRAAKCLVLDLDNTVWGGVVGDDGAENLVLGQGSAGGEAFVAIQAYARDLARRGIILAVCSKNDDTLARTPFAQHPEMVLRLEDITVFRANWQDKPANLRVIAETLNIGLDSLVFLDDNPMERNLVRETLPMVSVPEFPDDPALVPYLLSRAGYFEALAITDEDRERTTLYRANTERESLRASTTDLASYLHGLEMRLIVRPFDRMDLTRTVQLINKTNQFNLTTRRYTEAEVEAVRTDRAAFGLTLRLVDRFGDNGIIGVVIGRIADGICEIDTWLMSCRVLGREVESTTLNLLAAIAKARGATTLVGVYIPTKRNGMVRDHYPRLGFVQFATEVDGTVRHALKLATYTSTSTFITVEEN